MIDQIPTEFGRVIPQPMVRCSQCGRLTIEIDKQDDEPLCGVCRINDRIGGELSARAAVLELVTPIEGGGERRAFGRGAMEIGSSELVASMAHEREVERDAKLCGRLTWWFWTFEGLLILGAAAMR